MNFSIFTLFCVTVAILTISPGPDIFFVVSQSLHKGYKYGIKISLGLVTGLFVYTIALSFGLSLLMDQFPNISSSIKIFGGFYIGMLAIKEFPVKEKLKTTNSVTDTNPFFIGLLMNLSNPKVMLFFISLFPQFLFHNSWPIKYQFLVLGIVFIVIAFLIFSLVSVLSDYLIKSKTSFNPKYFSYLSCFILGSISVLILIGEIKNIFE